MKIPAKEIKAAVELSFKIPGLYRHGEAAFLYRLARRKGNIVELGCWMGRTTSILLQAASVWGATVTTVDMFQEIPTQKRQATPEKWRANLKKLALTPPHLLIMPTDEAIKIYKSDISFLFIDAGHGKDQVSRDIANWTQLVKVGGVVAFHDMFYPSITGVCLAVTEWWSAQRDENKPRWEYVGQHDYTIAFKRLR